MRLPPACPDPGSANPSARRCAPLRLTPALRFPQARQTCREQGYVPGSAEQMPRHTWRRSASEGCRSAGWLRRMYAGQSHRQTSPRCRSRATAG
ncbi:MAG: hypothetical protein DI568_02660 [Sphingomonas sp.]|nr:MAG: hypothetical protein DI568_02660 [Sphingomonas sp.]